MSQDMRKAVFAGVGSGKIQTGCSDMAAIAIILLYFLGSEL